MRARLSAGSREVPITIILFKVIRPAQRDTSGSVLIVTSLEVFDQLDVGRVEAERKRPRRRSSTDELEGLVKQEKKTNQG